MFPFASHATYGYTLEYCAPLLKRVGMLANKLGHRLTTHPGQYTQLGSPKPEVVQSAVRELVYHCELLDRMGVGVDGVMIVHVSPGSRLTDGYIIFFYREVVYIKINLLLCKESKKQSLSFFR